MAHKIVKYLYVILSVQGRTYRFVETQINSVIHTVKGQTPTDRIMKVIAVYETMYHTESTVKEPCFPQIRCQLDLQQRRDSITQFLKAPQKLCRIGGFSIPLLLSDLNLPRTTEKFQKGGLSIPLLLSDLNLPNRQQSPSDNFKGYNQQGQYQNLHTE